ncbi:hypothetical protein A8990_14310 [Paenibacillus taihuensis]|uniref:Uncharacterized protein n=1 Tax=Paenibacillus taihuensis TaxID=1156355 RepID=A0A3D9QUA4_9BACL|nr:hypothetical protein [Paenibacillus taihuensis]REE67305.1 hypothetical protein A8990_14310 [Paenibacillus taihuensis]
MSNFQIQITGNVVSWVILNQLNISEVAESIDSIKTAVSEVKKTRGTVKILVDNSFMAEDGAVVFTPEIAEKWSELQSWFVKHLGDYDKIGVIQGKILLKMQMTRLGKEIGLNKIERHFCEKTYGETKSMVYEYLGISSNQLIDQLALARS